MVGDVGRRQSGWWRRYWREGKVSNPLRPCRRRLFPRKVRRHRWVAKLSGRGVSVVGVVLIVVVIGDCGDGGSWHVMWYLLYHQLCR